MDTCNIPLINTLLRDEIDKYFIQFKLNEQSSELYNLTEMLRCAAILNYIASDGKYACNENCNEVIDRFLYLSSTNSVIDVFCKNFKQFFAMFIHSKFGKSLKIRMLPIVKTVVAFPVAIFMENETLLMFWSALELRNFMNNLCAIYFIYNGSETFVLQPLKKHNREERYQENCTSDTVNTLLRKKHDSIINTTPDSINSNIENNINLILSNQKRQEPPNANGHIFEPIMRPVNYNDILYGNLNTGCDNSHHPNNPNDFVNDYTPNCIQINNEYLTTPMKIYRNDKSSQQNAYGNFHYQRPNEQPILDPRYMANINGNVNYKNSNSSSSQFNNDKTETSPNSNRMPSRSFIFTRLNELWCHNLTNDKNLAILTMVSVFMQVCTRTLMETFQLSTLINRQSSTNKSTTQSSPLPITSTSAIVCNNSIKNLTASNSGRSTFYNSRLKDNNKRVPTHNELLNHQISDYTFPSIVESDFTQCNKNLATLLSEGVNCAENYITLPKPFVHVLLPDKSNNFNMKNRTRPFGYKVPVSSSTQPLNDLPSDVLELRRINY